MYLRKMRANEARKKRKESRLMRLHVGEQWQLILTIDREGEKNSDAHNLDRKTSLTLLLVKMVELTYSSWDNALLIKRVKDALESD